MYIATLHGGNESALPGWRITGRSIPRAATTTRVATRLTAAELLGPGVASGSSVSSPDGSGPGATRPGSAETVGSAARRGDRLGVGQQAGGDEHDPDRGQQGGGDLGGAGWRRSPSTADPSVERASPPRVPSYWYAPPRCRPGSSSLIALVAGLVDRAGPVLRLWSRLRPPRTTPRPLPSLPSPSPSPSPSPPFAQPLAVRQLRPARARRRARPSVRRRRRRARPPRPPVPSRRRPGRPRPDRQADGDADAHPSASPSPSHRLPSPSSRQPRPSGDPPSATWRPGSARQPGRILVVTDFDGTISEIDPDPMGATIDPGARRGLRRLARFAEDRPDRLALACSPAGPIADVAGRVRIGGVHYLGNHGLDAGLAGPPRPAGRGCAPRDRRTTRDSAAARLGRTVAEALGRPAWLFVEVKGGSVAFHYRQAPGGRHGIPPARRGRLGGPGGRITSSSSASMAA